MELSAEEKNKIYEEEKCRIEAQEKAKKDLKEKNFKTGCLGCLGLIVISLIIGSIVAFFTSPKMPDTSKAKPYTIIEEASYNFTTRNRKGWYITANAYTFEDLAQTAIKAAIDLQNKTSANVVVIDLLLDAELIGKGYLVAKAYYAPDGMGWSGEEKWHWNVDATDKPLDEESTKIAVLWERYYPRFLKSDGLRADVDQLKNVVASELNIDITKVYPPFYGYKKYLFK